MVKEEGGCEWDKRCRGTASGSFHRGMIFPSEFASLLAQFPVATLPIQILKDLQAIPRLLSTRPHPHWIHRRLLPLHLPEDDDEEGPARRLVVVLEIDAIRRPSIALQFVRLTPRRARKRLNAVPRAAAVAVEREMLKKLGHWAKRRLVSTHRVLQKLGGARLKAVWMARAESMGGWGAVIVINQRSVIKDGMYEAEKELTYRRDSILEEMSHGGCSCIRRRWRL